MTTGSRFPSVETLAKGVLAGNRALLARAITLVESSRAPDRPLADELVRAVLPHTGSSYRIGWTGPPGVGKSSLIEALGKELVSGTGQKLAVLAIDPSSRRTGGSILGDKTRMTELGHHPQVYIRPSAAGNYLGGTARHTRETLLLCEAAGFDHVWVETVGVGQSEQEVHRLVDLFVVLAQPGAGDDLQGIKRGILELADLLVVTKADGPLLQSARQTQLQLLQALRLFPPQPSGWSVPVLSVSSEENTGLTVLLNKMEEFRSRGRETGFWETRRMEQQTELLFSLIQENWLNKLYSHPDYLELARSAREKLATQNHTPDQLAEEFFRLLRFDWDN
jgi:LAO/AO transport system kinase